MGRSLNTLLTAWWLLLRIKCVEGAVRTKASVCCVPHLLEVKKAAALEFAQSGQGACSATRKRGASQIC